MPPDFPLMASSSNRKRPADAALGMSVGGCCKRPAAERPGHGSALCIPVLVLLIQNGFRGPFSVANVELAVVVEQYLACREGHRVAALFRKAMCRLNYAVLHLNFHFWLTEWETVREVRALRKRIDKDTENVVKVCAVMKAYAQQEGVPLRLLAILRAVGPAIFRVTALHSRMVLYLQIIMKEKVSSGDMDFGCRRRYDELRVSYEQAVNEVNQSLRRMSFV